MPQLAVLVHPFYTMSCYCNNLLLIPIYTVNQRRSVTQYQFKKETNDLKIIILLFLLVFTYLAQLVLYIRDNYNK